MQKERCCVYETSRYLDLYDFKKSWGREEEIDLGN